MAREQLEEKFKKWLSNNELGTKALRKRMASLSVNNHEEEEGPERESVPPEDDNFSLIIEQVLKQENTLLPSHLQEFDLTFEEKLLLLSTLGIPGEHFRSGSFALKANRQLVVGDTYGDAGLVKPLHANYVIIATEDTHVITITRSDYKLLFATDIQNIKEKTKFLRNLFPTVSKHNITEMAYYLEEKVLFNTELAYKEGEDADAIYLIKQGEIEISTTKEPTPIEDLMLEEYKPKTKNKFTDKKKIMIGKLPVGSVFGEEELLKKMAKRKYSARAYQPSTFLYVIKKRIFNEIFEPHFPEIVEILKVWMDLKYRWREQRIQKEKQIADLRTENDENIPNKQLFERKKVQKEKYSLDKRRATEGQAIENGFQTFHTEESIITANPSLNLDNALMPSNIDFSNTSSLYFTKAKRNLGSPRETPQGKVTFKRSTSRELVQDVEGIQRQKTKLFIENQFKLNKRSLLVQNSNSKNHTPRKKFETSVKGGTPVHSQTPNYIKTQESQKSETASPYGFNHPSQNSSKKISLPQTSPRSFMVKSYETVKTLNTISDSENLFRRNSSYLLRDQENLAQILVKNLDFRRGTLPSYTCDTQVEDENHDQMKYRLQTETFKPKKIQQNFITKPVNSLQKIERNYTRSNTQTSSNPGSLAYIDSKNDTSLQDQISTKNTLGSLKDEALFGKKILSPRSADQVKISPRVAFNGFKLKAK